jgi:hypothetical protein
MILREEALVERARAVLGIQPDAGENEIKYAYYRRMFAHHPDRNPTDPNAHEMASLIGEAYQFLMGKNGNPVLLKRNSLIALLINSPIPPLERLLSYEDWLKRQFYNMDDKSIWAY